MRIIIHTIIFLAAGIFSVAAQDTQESNSPNTEGTIPELSGEFQKVDQKFLGLHLGCTREEAMKVIENGSNDVSLHESAEDSQVVRLIYKGNWQLGGAEGSMLTFFRGHLLGVYVVYKENKRKAEKVYDVLKEKIQRKYDGRTISEKNTLMTKVFTFYHSSNRWGLQLNLKNLHTEEQKHKVNLVAFDNHLDKARKTANEEPVKDFIGDL